MAKSKPYIPAEYLVAIARLKEKRGSRKLTRGDCKFWMLVSPSTDEAVRPVTIAAGATAHEAWMSSRVDCSFAEIECKPISESASPSTRCLYAEQAVIQCIP